MGKASASSAVVVFAITMLAGCVGSDASREQTAGPAGSAAPPTFDDSTGALEGVVVDDESRPLPNAEVAVLSSQPPYTKSALSALDGRFSLSNIPPGRYQLVAQKLGYDAAAQTVEVRSGEVLDRTLILVPIAVHEGYHRSWSARGYFECSWTGVAGTGPCFFGIIGTNTSTVPVDPWTNNKRQWDYGTDPGPVTVMNEMTWQQTSVGTGEKMSVFLSYQKRTTSHNYCFTSSTKPVVMRWERGDLDEKQGTCETGSQSLPSSEPKTIPLKGDQILTSRVNVGTPGIGFAIQQSFDIYFSIFYWEPSPEGYSALPDA